MKMLLDNARNAISEYCYTSCGAKCCKKGYIVLEDEAMIDVVVGDRKKKFFENKRLKKMESGQYSLHVEGGCPSLDENDKCKIHKHPLKPKLCSDFPLFPFGKTVLTGPYCPAVNEGELDKEFAELKKEGYKII